MNANTGHGHVRPRPDGMKARCGGPRLCSVCARELPAVESPPLAPFANVGPWPPGGGFTLQGRRVIGFTGKAGSGKSTAARHLIEQHGFRRGKFAAALKDMIRTLLRYRGVDAVTVERMVEGDLKEVPTPHLNGRTPRHAMQTLGTEWGRNCIDENLWVDTEMDATAALPAVVFDDIRFQNEVDAVLRAGGVVVEVSRPGAGEAAAGHSSEDIGALKYNGPTLLNAGPITEFLRVVDSLLVADA
jgi:hypothetical protein